VSNKTEELDSLPETQDLSRVYVFAEGFLSGPRHNKSLPRAALGTAILTALPPLPRVGPLAGWDPRHNQVFSEGQRSTWNAPSEKERVPSHLGCRPLCWRLCRWAVGTDSTCAESCDPTLGKAVDHGLPRLTGLLPRVASGRRQSTPLCRRPTLGTGTPMPRAPLGSRQRSSFLFIFGLSFSLLKVH
jgi:hypothetical protein